VSAAAAHKRASQSWTRGGAVMIAAACLAAAVISRCANGDHDSPPAPGSPLLAPHVARPTDEPGTGAEVTVTARAGATGRGALARRLPLRFRGWQLSLAQISPGRGDYLITVLPPAGRRATPAAAARLLRAAAHTFGDDPSAYRPLVPMSALAGAHRDRDGR
jgi:hypothetical protein